MTVDSHGMPVRLSLSEGTVADCTQAYSLIADIAAEYLLADRGCDPGAMVAEAQARGIEPVTLPKSLRAVATVMVSWSYAVPAQLR